MAEPAYEFDDISKMIQVDHNGMKPFVLCDNGETCWLEYSESNPPTREQIESNPIPHAMQTRADCRFVPSRNNVGSIPGTVAHRTSSRRIGIVKLRDNPGCLWTMLPP